MAQAVAAWRERRAASVDVPVRQILPDLAILGIAQKHPSTPAELAHARGVEERHSRGAIGAEILAAVQAGLARDVSVPVPEGDELDRSLRPAVTLVSAWVSEVARAERIDTALLATRADLVALLRGDREARLASGWRAELLGDGVRSLVEGRAGLTFDGAAASVSSRRAGDRGLRPNAGSRFSGSFDAPWPSASSATITSAARLP
ncbi:MAG: HRDC domain-containing protein [Ilumatobacteraceae bacterium]